MTTTPDIWIPKGADRDAWKALVDNAAECIRVWLEGTGGMTIADWHDLLSGEREIWGGVTADDWRTGFAQRILDHYDPDEIHQSILDAFWQDARDEGRWDDDNDAEDVAYACAEVAWREAVDTAEDRLGA